MPIERAGTEVADAASGEDKINSLLGGDLPQNGGGERVAEDPSVADADFPPAKEAPAAREEEAEGELSDEEGASAEEESGDEEFSLTEKDSDFSADAYARAAKHYSGRAGRELDPNDPGDRFLLRELMARGQKIAELQRVSEEDEEAEELETGKGKGKTAEDAAPTAPAKLTLEQIMERVQGSKAYAKQNLVPEVAMDFANSLMKAMWPEKTVNMTQAQANALTETFSSYGALMVADAIPHILAAVPQAVRNGDPMISRAAEMAERESAIDDVLDARDKAGKPMYPDFEKLAESGVIKQMMNSDELKDAQFHKDPYKNLVTKLKFAYRLAKNQTVNVAALEKATERGRETERERSIRVGAGRALPSGSSGGGFAAPNRASNFIGRLVRDSGSKFSKAVADSKKK